jgi:hypothetical protein
LPIRGFEFNVLEAASFASYEVWQQSKSSKGSWVMKNALIYLAVAFALTTGIIATVVFQPEAVFACTTGDCSAG